MKPVFILLMLLFLGVSGLRAETAPADRTLSPYFWVKSAGPGTDGPAAGEPDPLPLKSTRVDATIAGVFAEVRVTQRYANTGTLPLEAVYIFPGSTRAAVHGLTLTVGERRIEAKTKERGEARRTYETARAEGKTASLLEEQRPNVFQMNVANILPGDDVQVELRYTELLTPTEGIYAFVYPGVVGPRYSHRPAEGASEADAWVANPYLRKGGADPATFTLNVRLAAGLPLQDVLCRSHSTRIDYVDDATATVGIDDPAASNRDFVLQYRLAGDAIQSGLLLAEGVDENFFLLLLQPPARVTPAQIPPREYVFVVDVSGSMRGFPLETTKGLLRSLAAGLRPQDRFNLILFSGDNQVFRPASVAADPGNLAAALDLLDQQGGGGGTELLPALRTALAMPGDAAASRTFVVVTDGYVDVEAEAFRFVREQLGSANLFAFGIGSSVNRHLIEGLARAGQAEPFVVTDTVEAAGAAARFKDYVSAPVLTRVKVRMEGFEAYDVEPVALPDLLAQRPLVVFGKWRGEPRGRLWVEGLSGLSAYQAGHDVAAATRLDSTDGLARLWARSRIAQWNDLAVSGEADQAKAAITALGLRYNLLTRHTSFVAVDEVVRRSGPTLETVKQPLPLPAGVEESAVGGVGAAPEPSTYLLLAAGLLALAVACARGLRR